MKQFLSLITALLTAVALSSCSHTTSADIIAAAEASLDAGDYENARAVVQPLADTVNVNLYPSQRCRIALIYMHLAESNKLRYDDDLDVALQCYMKALHTSSDSVADFLRHLPVNELSVMSTLYELTSAISSPVDIAETPADSIPGELQKPEQTN